MLHVFHWSGRQGTFLFFGPHMSAALSSRRGLGSSQRFLSSPNYSMIQWLCDFMHKALAERNAVLKLGFILALICLNDWIWFWIVSNMKMLIKKEIWTDTFTNTEEAGNERNHSCITSTKRRSKNHRGNNRNQLCHIFVMIIVRSFIVNSWHNICLPIARQLQNVNIHKPSFVYGGHIFSPAQSLNCTSLT